jgi:hypothetical protein
MIVLDKTLLSRKEELLAYLKSEADKSFNKIKVDYTPKGKQSREINYAIIGIGDSLIGALKDKASNEKWDIKEVLENVLAINYARDVVMIEYRNKAWSYNYMDFSRRIGELWENFCRICFQLHPNFDSLIEF